MLQRRFGIEQCEVPNAGAASRAVISPDKFCHSRSEAGPGRVPA